MPVRWTLLQDDRAVTDPLPYIIPVSVSSPELGTPWETATENFGEEFVELRGLVGQVAMATMQMAQAGSNTQLGRMATRRPFSRRNRSARAPRSLRGEVAARPWWSRRAAHLLRGLRQDVVGLVLG
jgi:hypothetical protein